MSNDNPEYSADREGVHDMLEDGAIQYPSSYDYDELDNFVEDVVEILSEEPGEKNRLKCVMCMQEPSITDPTYEEEMDLTEHDPADLDRYDDAKAEEMRENGVNVYEVTLRAYCKRHEDSNVDVEYTELIEATEGMLDLD